MITSWRKAFKMPKLFFSFVQLSSWCTVNVSSIPQMREAQMAAAKLENVGWVTNADKGMACTIHPGAKVFSGRRLGDAALALNYGKKLQWKSPRYVAAKQSSSNLQSAGAAALEVTLSDVGASGLKVIRPSNYFPEVYGGPMPAVPGMNRTHVDCSYPPTSNISANGFVNNVKNQTGNQCGWAQLNIAGHGWVNATATATSSGVTITANSAVGGKILGSSYGWAPIPMLSLYDRATDLPVLGWNASLPALKTDDTEDDKEDEADADAAAPALTYKPYPGHDCQWDDAECEPFKSCRGPKGECVFCCEKADPPAVCHTKLEKACNSNSVPWKNYTCVGYGYNPPGNPGLLKMGCADWNTHAGKGATFYFKPGHGPPTKPCSYPCDLACKHIYCTGNYTTSTNCTAPCKAPVDTLNIKTDETSLFRDAGLAVNGSYAALVAVDVVVNTTAKGEPFEHKWKKSFGSGHSSLTLRDDWRAHLALAAEQLGLGGVRYHGIFDDDMAVVTRGADGQIAYNFTLVDSTWDFLLAHGVKPIVELSFMPAVLANCSWHGHCPQNKVGCTGYWCTQCNGKGVLNGSAIINPGAPPCHALEFHYQGIKQMPADYNEWYELVKATVQHAVTKYTLKEVQTWNFEVWNELWGMDNKDWATGDYMRLYNSSALAVKV